MLRTEKARLKAAESLGETNPSSTAADLVELIGNSEDYDIRRQAVKTLEKIGHDNETAINALVELIRNSEDYDIRWLAAYSLVEIGHSNETAINALVELIANSEDYYTRWQGAYSLVEISHSNETATNALVELIANSQSKRTLKRGAKSLEKIDPGNKLAAAVAPQKPGFLKKPGFSIALLVLGVSLLSLLIFFYQKPVKTPEIQQQTIPLPRATPSIEP